MPVIREKIKDPKDLRNLSAEDMDILQKEIRQEIIDVVSKNGGHLASNLGVVELTIALLRQFDFPEDTIIWDVGHQTYAYKMLTGRYDRFNTIRTCNGLSGFPKRCESDYDFFNTGHSSTSISAALGILRGKALRGDKSKVIAVIGDGALTGGMAFEALNDAGQSDTDLIVILNDNEMSISKNVGGMSKHLETIRISKKYLRLKSKSEKILAKTALGRWMLRMMEIIKHFARYLIRPQKVIFEDLGFKYYGPIDGHDLKNLEMHLNAVKNMTGPALIHVVTQKGRGYTFAEVSPEKYHGVSPFETDKGIIQSIKKDEIPITFSETFSKTLTEMAQNDPEICAVCAAMSSGTGLDKFERSFPDRFFDVGIAEQHAITMAAGIASVGLKPVIAIYSTFLQRGMDQLLHDIALQNLHVTICIDRAGIVGEDGETHQGIYDLSMLLGIPNLTILSPRDHIELQAMMNYALYSCDGPVAIRYPRGGQPAVSMKYRNTKTPLSGPYVPYPELLKEGDDITFVTEGTMFSNVSEACEYLSKEGITCDLIDIKRIKPCSIEIILNSARKTGRVITLENAININGMGSFVEGKLSEKGLSVPVVKLGVGDHPLCHGSVNELLELERMDSKSIYSAAKELLKAGK